MLADRVRMGRYKSSGGGAIYGVRITKNTTNPSNRVVYIDDAEGFTPMSGNNGIFSWGSWQDIFNSLEIRPCVLKNKVVQYYLNPNDYTKKADNTSAVITGADGDVMIEFGKPIWWKFTDEGTTYTIEFSDKAFSGAVKHAFEIEEGYNLVPYYALLLTQVLFVIFFKSTNSQAALGQGHSYNTGGYSATGATNSRGMFYGTNSNSTANDKVKFLGIEDYWGNKAWWIEGIMTDASRNILIGKGGFNSSGTGYQSFSSGLASNLSGFLRTIQCGNETGFIARAVGGSATTYYADSVMLRPSGTAPIFGGEASYFEEDSPGNGFARLILYWESTATFEEVGARLFCGANNKIYIGAYLGTSQSGKLRSISGTAEPTGSKSITTFRAEAQANNS